jgi:hypothetical protein
MHFFSRSGDGTDQPNPEELRLWARRSSPPENEIPGSAPISAVIGRAPGVALAVLNFKVYRTGLAFTLAVRTTRSRRGIGERSLIDLISPARPGRQMAAGEHLLLGVEYADGRAATNLTARFGPGFPKLGDDSTPMLQEHGGSGDDRSFDQEFWLYPLPPAGPLTFVAGWTIFEIAETRTVVDGAAIVDAAARSEELWPWQPPDDDLPEEPPEPDLPAGWFADVARRHRQNDG